MKVLSHFFGPFAVLARRVSRPLLLFFREAFLLGHLVRPQSPELNQMILRYVLHRLRHQQHVRMQRWLLGSASPSIVNTVPNRSTYTTPNIIPNIGASTHRQKFIVGEQVYITNRITHSINPGPLDRAAIVTRVRPRRIDFRTFSGQETWRSPGNLRHLTEQEIASINNLLNSNS